jgi:REP element-mobilizing transposase RayT
MSEQVDETKFWHTRGHLPHFDDGIKIQFITFRLADSLPVSVLDKARWKLDNGRITEMEYHREIDKWLDKGLGDNSLRDPRIAEVVAENLRRFTNERYKLYSWVVMPNHVHLLLSAINGFSISKIMHGLKSYTSHRANEILSRTGHFWSKEYFDRYMRSAEHFWRTIDYIEYNPVKANLCKRPQDWMYSSAAVTNKQN